MDDRKIIYLDNNATTQVDQRVLEAMIPYFTIEYANANSTHLFGVNAHEAVKKARNQIAELIKAEPYEIIFTSGSTEAINLAIKGCSESYLPKGKHIVTVTTEHSAVLDTCKYLENEGYEITYLPVQNDGLINLPDLASSLREDTILVAVMLANNETGVIQPIKAISELAHNVGAIFMSDTTQAIGKIPVNVDEDGIDLLCLSGHKFYAPKGIGAIYVRQRGPLRLKIPALIHGGGHERGFRSGTLNVPGIVALGKACEIAKNELDINYENLKELRDYLEKELLKINGTSVNGNIINRLPNTTNILFEGVDSDALIMGLSDPDTNSSLIAVSNGSACTSTSVEPSHVLTAMGLNETEAFSSIRFSFGKYNDKEEVDSVIDSIKNIVNELRNMAQK